MYGRLTTLLCLFLVFAAFAMSAYYYPQLPERMASHWNGAGRVDGYMGKFWGAFFIPLLTVFVWLVMTLIPLLAPDKAGLGPPARRAVGRFTVVLFLFLIVVQFQVLQWNLGNEISFAVTIPVGIGILFFVIGSMLGTVTPNWVVGIRTYWTLKHPVVWARTHQRAGILFRILGVIYMMGAFFREYILLFMLLPALFLALYLPAYSFLLYQKIEKVHQSDSEAE